MTRRALFADSEPPKPGPNLPHPARTPSMVPSRDPVRAGEPDDESLVRTAQQGADAGRAALEQLLLRHERRVYATCMRIVGDPEAARDLTQDTFIRVIGAIDSFDGRARFTTWMTRIAMNACISHQRRSRIRRGPSLDDHAPGPDGASIPRRDLLAGTEPSPLGRVEMDEDLGRLAQAFRTLDAEQRSILVLRDVRGLDYREVAETLSIPVGTVKSRLFRARQALREAVESLPVRDRAD